MVPRYYADKMQKEFINIASHEIKTPTQAILGYSQLIQHHPERRDQMILGICRNATRLQKLTNDILDVTRIESQTLKLSKEQFNLNDLIVNIVEDYRNQIEKDKNNVKLLYNQPKSYDAKDKLVPVVVEADKGRIAQVIYNLLSNAVKFTSTEVGEGGGRRTVLINREIKKYNNNNNNNNNQEVLVSVKDNGEGIDSEMQARLFTKFATKSFDGTGLGLYISKGIIEAHGGRIWAENNKDIVDNVEKRGATFSFTLPLMTNKIQSNSKQEQNSKGSQLSKEIE
jgi:signal transduction histidine kinase